MAMLNEIHGQADRFNQALSRKFGIIGGSPSPQLTPEIAPGFSWEAQPEDRIIAYDYLASGYKVRAAGAGQRSVISLSNPTTSQNLLVIVERVEFYTGANDSVVVGVNKTGALADLPAAGDVTYRDTRVSDDGTYTRLPIALLRSGLGPPSITQANLTFRVTAAGISYSYDFPVILAPGWSLQVATASNNITLVASYAWREVTMAPGENARF